MKIRKLMFLVVILMPLPLHADFRIFACEPEWAALAEELGGDRVEVTSATQAKQDPHYIQARPSLIARARKADLLVCTGAGLESGWLPVLLRKAANPRILAGKPGHLITTDLVSLEDVPTVVDRSMGDIHAAGNPHIQTDPRNIAIVAAALAERLVLLDAANQDEYRRRYTDFSVRWKNAIERWEQKAAALKGMPVMVYHRSWVYLENWLGLKEVAALEPKPGIPPNSGHLAELLELAKKENVKVVIHGQYKDTRSVDWFSQRSGVPVALIPTTVGGTTEASDLFSWFDDIVNRLVAIAELQP